MFSNFMPRQGLAGIGIKSKPNEANNEANVMPIEANHETNDRNIVDTILFKLIENPYIAQRKLSEEIGVSRSTLQRTMDELKQQGRIERIGGTRGYWKVNKS